MNLKCSKTIGHFGKKKLLWLLALNKVYKEKKNCFSLRIYYTFASHVIHNSRNAYIKYILTFVITKENNKTLSAVLFSVEIQFLGEKSSKAYF